MDSDSFPHTEDSSLLNPMVVSTGYDAILQLGKKLVDEFELDTSTDTLGRWMAHYIAELIHDAETAVSEERIEKRSRCAKAILEFWKHRREFPNGKRPFEDVEPILRALESLDPQCDTPRYFASLRTGASEVDQNPETKRWLELIDGIDYSAKVMIRFCLVQAAQNGLDKSKEWVSLTENLGEEDSIDLSVVRTISDENDLLNTPTLKEFSRKEIENRIKRLDGFIGFASTLLTELRQKLSKSDNPPASS